MSKFVHAYRTCIFSTAMVYKFGREGSSPRSLSTWGLTFSSSLRSPALIIFHRLLYGEVRVFEESCKVRIRYSRYGRRAGCLSYIRSWCVSKYRFLFGFISSVFGGNVRLVHKVSHLPIRTNFVPNRICMGCPKDLGEYRMLSSIVSLWRHWSKPMWM